MIYKGKLPSLLALTVRAKPADNGALPDTFGKVRGTWTAPTTRAPITEYAVVLGRLWLLNAPDASPSGSAHDTDVADAGSWPTRLGSTTSWAPTPRPSSAERPRGSGRG